MKPSESRDVKKEAETPISNIGHPGLYAPFIVDTSKSDDISQAKSEQVKTPTPKTISPIPPELKSPCSDSRDILCKTQLSNEELFNTPTTPSPAATRKKRKISPQTTDKSRDLYLANEELERMTERWEREKRRADGFQEQYNRLIQLVDGFGSDFMELIRRRVVEEEDTPL